MNALATLPHSSKQHARPWLLHAANLLYLLVPLVGLMGSAQGPSSASLDPGVALIAAQIALILQPGLLFVWLTRQPVRSTLKLNPLSLGSAARCFLVGLLGWAVFVFFSNLTTALLATLHPIAANQPTNVVSGGGALWPLFFGVAVVAPLCEEALFRGVMLSTYEERFGIHAIWLVGILFAAVHQSIDQVLGALFIGLLAGWVVYRTRSLWAGILLHIGTNLVSALLVLLVALAAPGGIEGAAQEAAGAGLEVLWTAVMVWGGVSVVLLAPLLLLLRGLGRRYPAPDVSRARPSLAALWSYVVVIAVAVASLAYQLR
jgi:membrane protease YdiL (CAAX protease family)